MTHPWDGFEGFAVVSGDVENAVMPRVGTALQDDTKIESKGSYST